MIPSRRADRLLVLFLAAAAAALVWPGPLWAGTRVEPYVLGLPFVFAWHLLWIVLTFGALVLYHRAVDGGRDS